MPDTISVRHSDMQKGRALLATYDLSELGIPSVSPVLDTRWKAEFKGKFLQPGENEKFLTEVLTVVKGLKDVTTQRAVYYALRGAHPEWTYKGEPLGQEFYDHLISWIMEKAQLMTGMTMQAMGVWAGPRGWIAGDGAITSRQRGRAPLSARPQLDFDLADEGVVLASYARKVIHFEKDAGLGAIISDNFPQYTEAIYSTSQGALTEAATKFLRSAEDKGYELYAIHDGDPSGIQMQLMHGMASKNNCYMPSEFYPQTVKPLGFYPSVGLILGLPPEAVTEKEDKIFNNLIALANERQKRFRHLRRYKLGDDVRVIVEERKKWEFQALNAIHESAPKIYILEALRVHEDPVKYVHDAQDIKDAAIVIARQNAAKEVESSLASLAQNLYDKTIKAKLVDTLRTALAADIQAYNDQVEDSIQLLSETEAENFREEVKWKILSDPRLYSEEVVKKLGKDILTASFNPKGTLKMTMEVTNVSAAVNVSVSAPEEQDPPLTKTQLINAIEKRIVRQDSTRNNIVKRLRSALEQHFGAPDETW